MPNAYLVMENEFIYNDEYNELLTTQGTCSSPQRIFWTRENAEAKALEIARQRILGEPLYIWGLVQEDISSLEYTEFYSQLGALLGKKFADSDGYHVHEIPTTLNETKFKQLLKLCDKLQIAVVVETQITDENLFVEAAQTLETKQQANQSKLEQITQLFGLPYKPIETDD